MKKDEVSKVSKVTYVSEVIGSNKKYQKSNSESSNITVEEPPSTIYNLAAEIRNYVECSIGTFNLTELNNYLGLDRSQAKNRNKVLSSLCKQNILIRVGNGVYERCLDDIVGVSLDNVATDNFDINLPLGLSELVNIPRKSIIGVAGTSNSGKTLFALETIKLNLHQNYDLAYFFSEMGISEYKSRVIRTCKGENETFELWKKKVFSGERANGFAPVIYAKCKDGLGVIDFLQPPEGDYSKMTHEITRIYDRMSTGVVLINLQKGTDLDYGRGGEGTKEKARLFITLQEMKETESGSMVAVRIIKAKEPKKGNVNKKEIHVLMARNGEMIPLSDWMWVKTNEERKRMFDVYDTESDGDRKIRMLGATSYSGATYSETTFVPDESKVEGLF